MRHEVTHGVRIQRNINLPWERRESRSLQSRRGEGRRMRSRSGRKVLLQECRGAQYTICCREVKEERSGLSKSQQKGGLLWWLSRKESAINLCFRKIPWRRKWQPTPVFLPRKTHGQGSLVGYSPWDCKESDTT